MKEEGTRFSALTAYDYPTARLVDAAGVDLILVGDSLGMALQGRKDTLSVTMEAMLYHTEMVSRAAERALVVADMPFMSYQISPAQALENAGRFVAESGAHAVKLEGPAEKFGDAARAIVRAGIPVLGHIGLTPQSVHQIGGYKIQGTGPEAEAALVREAKGLEECGCFAVVLELVRKEAARRATESIRIPTLGIGSGPHCDGQVLIMHDMLGFGAPGSFSKVYEDVAGAMKRAFAAYDEEVKNGTFPAEEHSR
jgi:3-methyl-2-oxobutanoate hydroxymethyltransferase